MLNYDTTFWPADVHGDTEGRITHGRIGPIRSPGAGDERPSGVIATRWEIAAHKKKRGGRSLPLSCHRMGERLVDRSLSGDLRRRVDRRLDLVIVIAGMLGETARAILIDDRGAAILRLQGLRGILPRYFR